MPPFRKAQFSFTARGVDLNAPADMLRPGYFPYLMNMRRATSDSLEPRHGLGDGLELIAGQTVHSICRINDADSGIYGSAGSAVASEIVGVGTSVYSVTTDLAVATAADLAGYSGLPLSIVTYKPIQSVLRYAYVADSLRMRKFPPKVTMATPIKQIGLPAPTTMPTVALDAPLWDADAGFTSAGSWITQTGTAGVPAYFDRLVAADRSIETIIFDSGSRGWASIVPINAAHSDKPLDGITAGTVIYLAGYEPVMVREVMQGSRAWGQSYIKSIVYESGTSGLCSIHLTIPLPEVRQDAVVRIGSPVSYTLARVLSVHPTQDGQTSFRCSLGSTFSGGGTVGVGVLPSFRTYVYAAGITNGATIYSTSTQFAMTTGTGAISKPQLGDYATIGPFVSGMGSAAVQPDDYMGITLYVDHPANISEIKIYMDLDDGISFNGNYFVHVIRTSDLAPLVTGQISEIDAARIKAQRDAIDRWLAEHPMATTGYRDRENRPHQRFQDTSGEGIPPAPITGDGTIRPPGPGADQLNPAAAQWSTVEWKLSDLYLEGFGRVGTDYSKTLRDVKGYKVEVIATGAAVIRLGDLYTRGGFSADATVIGRPRQYRYRGRDSSTGVVSNWSPASFQGAAAKRERVYVTLTQQSSSEVDKLDVEILGGELLGWHYAGSIPNIGSAFVFEDTYSDMDLANVAALSEGNTHYQLWPQIRPPRAGVAATIAGNLVSLGGGELIPQTTAPGTAIRLAFADGAKDFTIHSINAAGTRVYLTQSAGATSGAAIAWEIPEPLVMAQPMPVLAGPFMGFMLGCGDDYNPQRLYYANGNDPDSTQDTHWIDIESDILQNIMVLEGRAIVFSTTRAFVLEPTFTMLQSGGNLFTYREIPNSRGLWARWACCVADGEAIFLGEDGIYATSGGGMQLLSGDLRPLFPKGSSLGAITNGIAAMKMVAADAHRFRLAYAYRELYFDYIDTDGATRTLVNERAQSGEWLGWLPQSSTPGTAIHYGDEGENAGSVLAGGYDGSIYRMAADQGESGGGFGCEILTPDHNFGDARQSKYLGDALIDYDPDGASITATPGYNHRATTDTSVALTTTAGRRQTILDLALGNSQRGKDVSLDLTVTVTTERPKFYLYEFTYSERPDSTKLRATDYEMKSEGVKYCRGVWILADTDGRVRTANFNYTNEYGLAENIVIDNIQHYEMTERFYPFADGVYLVAARLHPDTSDIREWEFVDYRLEAEPAPPKTQVPTPWQQAGDGLEARFVQGVVIDIDTEDADVDMQVQVDESIVQTTISAAANKGPVRSDGHAQIGYSFDVPFITHLIRLVPLSDCRLWGFRVISEPEPELAYMWWTQQTDFGSEKFKVFGDGSISVRSTSAIILELVIDGVSYYPTFYDANTNTGGARRDLRFRCPAIKGKSVEFKLYAAVAAGKVAVYQKGFQINIKEWGSEGAWQAQSPVGANSFVKGAEI